MSKRIDLVGCKFGRLLVVEFSHVNNGGNTCWICKCDCGNIVTVQQGSLSNGNTKSCGCLHIENTSKSNKKHGRCKDQVYCVYHNMLRRCSSSLNKRDIKNYQNKGITVCDRWKESFENFLEDMGECPEGMTIDRIDNNKGYCKDNCRWATQLEQNNNKINNVYIILQDSVIMSFPEACRYFNAEYEKSRQRLRKLGWSLNKIFNLSTTLKVAIYQPTETYH